MLSLLEEVHNIKLGKRQLHRILRSMSLNRRHRKTPINQVICCIKDLIQGSESLFGYRLMHQKLRSMGYVIDQHSVRLILKTLDPDGVSARARKRLRRRTYISVGPNFTWHVDEYDKLKPFGFAIHGAIDGYSRKILWLNVSSSNNNPRNIAFHFVNCVETFGIVPRLVRSDRGSENISLGGIQRFFRRRFNDSSSKHSSFQFGKSTMNQRIEAWWSIFRRSRCNWWINFFKDLCEEEASLDLSIDSHLQCLRFCFMPILQAEMDETKRLWNTHRIRKVRNSECPAGRPDALFFCSSYIWWT